MLDVILDLGVLNLGGWTIPLRLHGYGLMLVLGFLAGMLLVQWRARRAGEDTEASAACGILALVGGIVGSRIAYVIQHWDSQFAHATNRLGAIFNLTSGGLIYYGGVALAIVLVVGYLLAKKLPIRRYLDFLAVSLMVGLAFGRAGCLLHGCCYGARCKADWALATTFPMYSKPLIKIDGQDNPFSQATEGPSPPYSHQLAQGYLYPDPALIDQQGRLTRPGDFTPEQIAVATASRSLPVQPAQALGIANALLIAALLSIFYRLRRREGQVFALMLLTYPVTRFALESIRDDNPHDLLAGVLTHNQYTSLGMLLAGAVMMMVLQKLPASAGPAVAGRQADAIASGKPVKAGRKPSRRARR